MDDKAFTAYMRQKNKEIGVMERRVKELVRQSRNSKVPDENLNKEIRQLYERIQKECESLTVETLNRWEKKKS